MADKKISGTPQVIVEQKAPFKWWLVFVILGVLAGAVLLFTQLFATTPSDPCPPLYLEETSIPNALDQVQGDQTTLVFLMSGGDIPADMEFTAYWNVRVRGQADSYIRPTSVACSANHPENSISCSGLTFYFPEGEDEVVPEISIISTSPACGEHLLVDLETSVDRSGQQEIFRLEGEYATQN